MHLCSVSRDLELLFPILQRTSCPPVPFHVSSLASPLTHPGGSSTTPPRVVFCPLWTSPDQLSSRAVPCVFLGFPPDAPGWQFYHPTSRRILSSLDVTFDDSVSYYRFFPYHTASVPPPPPLFLAPGTPPVDPLPPQGPAPS
ncbi:unnamed protein product, partial [Closterium sp. NIES-53]